MLTLNYVKKMISSLQKEDGEFTFGDVYKWYEKYSYDFIHLKFPVNENHTVVVRLKDVPFNFRVVYKSTGKLDTYRTEILSLEVV